MPSFFGDNPTAWVSWVQRYFDYYNTLKNQHLIVVSYNLDGAALDWFDWMNMNGLINVGLNF